MNNLFDVKYPKVNYIGNKEKLSEWIVDNIPFDTGTVLDIFAGGNSVSFELKKEVLRYIAMMYYMPLLSFQNR